MSEADRPDVIQPLVEEILKELDEEPGRDGLQRTPARVAKALRFLTGGYHRDPYEILNGALFDVSYDEMVIVRDIEIYSLCEHHMLPFFGRAHVAYIPTDQIVGLSKLARIVEYYARRPQIQERMTHQIAEYIGRELKPQGSMVVVEARHLCMEMRGVEKPGTWTTTSAVRGIFKRVRATREEFLDLLARKREA